MNKMKKKVTHIFSVLYSFITIKKKSVGYSPSQLRD